MSHFSLAVITLSKPSDEELAALLQPYHEFECTGFDDEYVKDIDVTDETRKEYEEATESFVQGPHGELWRPWDDRFYRDPTPEETEIIGVTFGGSGYAGGISYRTKDWGDGVARTKVNYVPEGWMKIEKPAREEKAFDNWAADDRGVPVVNHEGTVIYGDEDADRKWGYVLLQENGTVKVIERTNPNRKWDWWQVGGRWSNHYGNFDQTRIGDIDFAELLHGHRVHFGKLWDQAHAIIAGRTFPQWKGGLLDQAEMGLISWDEAREQYNGNPVIKELRDGLEGGFWLDLHEFNMDRADYVTEMAARRASVFAYLKDGEWHEKGEMLMFGAVKDEKDPSKWATDYLAMIRDLPDHWLTVVDCHI